MIMQFISKRPSIAFLITEAVETLKRFPHVILISVLAGCQAIYASESSLYDDRLFFTLTLGIPLFLSLALYRESRGWKTLPHQLLDFSFGTAFLVLYFLSVKDDYSENFSLRFLHLGAILHLLVAFIPFIHERDENSFWQFNRYFFLRILLSILYATVLFGGLAIALLTIEKLFSIDIKGKTFVNLWLLSVFFFQTWHFLAGVPRLNILKEDNSYPQGLRFFVQYLLIPLVSLYTLILYAYMTKIAVTWDWPRGYIGWLVSVMSALGIFNLLLLEPVKRRSESRWVIAYSKYYYILIIPLLIMLFIAIGKRVEAYGFTEARYILLMLGLWLAGLASYFIFSRHKKIIVVPISLFTAGVFSFWGPWSAYGVSLASQIQRAEKLLTKHELFSAGKATRANQALPTGDERELGEIFNYIVVHHGAHALPTWLPGNYNDHQEEPSYSTRRQTTVAIMNDLGLRYLDRWDQPQREDFFFTADTHKNLFPVKDYESALEFSYHSYASNDNYQLFEHRGRSYKISFDKFDRKFRVTENSNNQLTIDMAAIVNKLRSANRKSRPALFASDELTAEVTNEHLSIRLILRSVRGEFDGEQPLVQDFEALLLLK